MHDIYKVFDANSSLEVRGVFLDLLKAFDRVWHKGVICKLERLNMWNGLWIYAFIQDKHQRIVFNGQFLNFSYIEAGIPQGSILGPLLFLVYANDLAEGLFSVSKPFADDSSLLSGVHNPKQFQYL